MRITSLSIKNFKSISALSIDNIDSALIIIGKNSTGKTAILEAVLAVAGTYEIKKDDFNSLDKEIEIGLTLLINAEDLKFMHQNGIVSHNKSYDNWFKDFCTKLPSYDLSTGELKFKFIATRDGRIKYKDGIKKDNPWIKEAVPKIHYIDSRRAVKEIEADILFAKGQSELMGLENNICMFGKSKECVNCFKCIKSIHNKKPENLSIFETVKLMQYKLQMLNFEHFIEKLNNNLKKNSGWNHDVEYRLKYSSKELFNPIIYLADKTRKRREPVAEMSEGIRSIYILSLLETYIDESEKMPTILMMEDPEEYLHPQLQKAASEILYKVSKKNQVIFSTHSPNLIFNFNSKQIVQVVLDSKGYTAVTQDTRLDDILDDLGYSANDLMNVSFVFIVEGKQDKARLPLLLKKYYDDAYDEKGELQRVAIISTNSCTNIRTYANLKYINKLYLRDQFLMIRDSDGGNKKELATQLTNYYRQQAKNDAGNLPRITDKNVLILGYYSFENYFLNPKIMTKIGVVKSEEQFYNILWNKYCEYLHKLKSTKNMLEKTGIEIRSKEDIKNHMEEIKTYIRGHNLYDIFYGRYKGEKEIKILTDYINTAPREEFKDILDAIDRFVFFESKKVN